MTNKQADNADDLEREIALLSLSTQAALCASAYLQEARISHDPGRTRELEAVAIKRAIIADKLRELANQRCDATQSPPAHYQPSSDPVSPREADHLLHRSCEDLEHNFHSRAQLRDLTRQLRLNFSRRRLHPASRHD